MNLVREESPLRRPRTQVSLKQHRAHTELKNHDITLKLQTKRNDYTTFHLYVNTYQKLTNNTYRRLNTSSAQLQEPLPVQELPAAHGVLIGIGTS